MKTRTKKIPHKRKTRKKRNRLNYQLLKKMTKIHAPSGEEDRIVDFLIDYIKKHKKKWKHPSKLYYGGIFKHNIILK